jgi:hypothetical protein
VRDGLGERRCAARASSGITVQPATPSTPASRSLREDISATRRLARSVAQRHDGSFIAALEVRSNHAELIDVDWHADSTTDGESERRNDFGMIVPARDSRGVQRSVNTERAFEEGSDPFVPVVTGCEKRKGLLFGGQAPLSGVS